MTKPFSITAVDHYTLILSVDDVPVTLTIGNENQRAADGFVSTLEDQIECVMAMLVHRDVKTDRGEIADMIWHAKVAAMKTAADHDAELNSGWDNLSEEEADEAREALCPTGSDMDLQSTLTGRYVP